MEYVGPFLYRIPCNGFMLHILSVNIARFLRYYSALRVKLGVDSFKFIWLSPYPYKYKNTRSRPKNKSALQVLAISSNCKLSAQIAHVIVVVNTLCYYKLSTVQNNLFCANLMLCYCVSPWLQPFRSLESRRNSFSSNPSEK
jgi:hypothetical protein